MDSDFTPDQEAFRKEVRHWLETNLPDDLRGRAFAASRADHEEVRKLRAWQKKMYEGGYVGIDWPREFGGRGASIVEVIILYQEMARAESPQIVNRGGVSMLGPTLMKHGTAAQQKRFLSKILSAEEMWCQGFSEPDAGSDLASLKTRAKHDGDGWVVSGQKVWTSGAQYSKWCMLLARSDADAPKHKGLTYFICDMDQDEIEVRPLRQITGEAEFNEIFLEDAYIPDENLVGGEGNGWNVAITTLMHERAGLGAASAITVRRELDELIALINERGLAGDPLIRQRIAEVKIGVEALRLGALRALTQQMKVGIPGPEGSLAKWEWATVNQKLTELAVDVLGPDALVPESEWAYRFLRARANSIEGGTTEVMKNIIAERVLGLPRLR